MGKQKDGKKKDRIEGGAHGAGPGPEDARVVLELYDLRREAVMRRSRETMLHWTPKSFDDVKAIAAHDHGDNAAYRQVSSYFEMAFGLARSGAVDAELVAEWCGEGILLYAKLEPYVAEYRERMSPTAFRNMQWIVENTEYGAQRLELFRRRLAPPAESAEPKA